MKTLHLSLSKRSDAREFADRLKDKLAPFGIEVVASRTKEDDGRGNKAWLVRPKK